MGLLKSIDNVSGIDYYEYRDSQYYNKYEYRMRVKIPGIRYTWYCKNTEELDKKIAGKVPSWSSIRKEDLPIVIDNVDALKTVIKLQHSRTKTKNLGMRVEGSTVAFFSSNLQDLQDIQTELSGYHCDYTQVQTSEYSGVKQFAGEPKHKYRVYLKSRKVEDKFPKELQELFKRTPSLHPSASLTIWLTRSPSWKYRFSSASHFIDYDDESTLSYLAIMHGEMLGKKYKLEKRPEQS